MRALLVAAGKVIWKIPVNYSTSPPSYGQREEFITTGKQR